MDRQGAPPPQQQEQHRRSMARPYAIASLPELADRRQLVAPAGARGLRRSLPQGQPGLAAG